MTNCASNLRSWFQLLSNNNNYLQDSLSFRIPSSSSRSRIIQCFCRSHLSVFTGDFYFQLFSLSLSLTCTRNQRDKTNKFSGHGRRALGKLEIPFGLETFRQPPLRDAQKKFDERREEVLLFRDLETRILRKKKVGIRDWRSFSILSKQRGWYAESRKPILSTIWRVSLNLSKAAYITREEINYLLLSNWPWLLSEEMYGTQKVNTNSMYSLLITYKTLRLTQSLMN